MIEPDYISPDGRCTLYCASYHDVLPLLVNLKTRADVVVTDPPYGETTLEWDHWANGWPTALVHLTGQIWSFGTLRMFMDHATDFRGWQLAQDLIWEKHNGSNSFADRFRRVHEQVAHFYQGAWKDLYRNPLFTLDATKRVTRRKKRPPQWGDIGRSVHVTEDGGPRRMRSVIHARSCHGHAIAPTQKPLDTLLPIIEYSCPQGGLVLDPFGGSFSTGVAALRLGARFIGIEIDVDQYQRGKQNILTELNSKRLQFTEKA